MNNQTITKHMNNKTNKVNHSNSTKKSNVYYLIQEYDNNKNRSSNSCMHILQRFSHFLLFTYTRVENKLDYL